MSSKTLPAFEVIGVGSPIVDQVLKVSEEYLSTVPGRKGGMEAIDYGTFQEIIRKSGSKPTLLPGGSGANVIRGLANLHRKCALIGKIGNDDIGRKFLHTLRDLDITPLYVKTPTPTAQVLSLVTPDGQRTLRSYLGAGQEMGPEDLDPSHFANAALVHIEGYTLLSKGLTEKSMEYAKEAGAIVSFDLASFEVVESFADKILHLLTHYVDIVIANEDETKMLMGASPKEGCERLKELCQVAVVLMGKEGCWIGSGKELLRCPAYPVEPVDTTGAGDLFTSGFLHGYLEGKPLDVCAHYGALMGAAVVQVLGAEIPPPMWHEIRQLVGMGKLD